MSRRRPRLPAPTVAALARESARKLRAARLAYGHGTQNARDEAFYLTLYALGLAPDAPARDLARTVAPRQAARVRALIGKRIRSRKPAAYLTRESWLAGHRFHVDERVIVPRSHIAAMLEERLSPWVAAPRRVRAVLDLCTGSGCLAVLAARAFPQARVDAADVSGKALAVARINRANYRLGRRMRLVRSDAFSGLAGKRYDLIICNPPYVTGASMRRLPPEYRHEPKLALAGGPDGLDLVRAILSRAPDHLTAGGLLVMEVGSGRRRVERAFPGTEFIWPEVPGGGDVLIAERDRLAR